MPTKIRLQRFGKKGRPFYHIVIADGRAPRDGRFIEKIGTYNPVAKPAEIILDFERAYSWITKGATPTPTVKNILSHEGVLFYNHLMKGVAKNAFTKEMAEVRFNEWKESKEARLSSAVKSDLQLEREMQKKRLEEEIKVNEARAAEIARKRQKEAEAAEPAREEEVTAETDVITESAPVKEQPVAEEPAKEESVAEEPAKEEPVAEEPAKEEPIAEEPAKEEPVAEEPAKEEPVAKDPAKEEPKSE
ncbi:MAG: 30S ribosomal protein S16 [Lentimicrobium sp.]|nr:30S ribosomal protein S16 [Lentimicrobium sp.]